MPLPAVRALRLCVVPLLLAAVGVACGPDAPRQVRLEIGAAPGGAVLVNGARRRLPWSTTLDAGSAVTLLGVPDEGYEFQAWSGDLVSGENPANLTVMADTSVTPVFSRLPELVFTPSAVEFGDVEVGSTRDVTLTLANHGGGLLDGIAETSAPFSVVDGAAFSLEAGEAHHITLRFSPTAPDQASGELRLSSARGERTLALSGTGTTEPPLYRGLSVSATGSGTVFSEPAGILCPPDCSAVFVEGSQLLLSVAPSSSVPTPRWSRCDTPAGHGVSSATCELLVTSDRVVFVDFTPDPELVVTPAAGDFGAVQIGAFREIAYTVANHGGGTITGTAEASAPFSVVSGAAYTLRAGESQEVLVRFSPQQVGEVAGELEFSGGTGVVVSLSGFGTASTAASSRLEVTITGNGRVSSEPAGIDCPGACSGTFAQGTEILLVSAPASPLGHAEWSGCDSPSGSGSEADTCELSLDADRTVEVDFPPTEDVLVSIAPATITLLTGESRAFTATVSGTDDTGLVWSATGGTLIGTGTTVTYTTPESEGAYVITATSVLDPTSRAQATVTVDARRVVSLAAGDDFSLALKNDGTVWAWGANDQGQLGIGRNTDSALPVQVTALHDVVKVVAGATHAMALDSNGYLWIWGGDFGSEEPVRDLGHSEVLDIAAGRRHSLVLRGDGTVFAWGDNLMGQLGNGTAEPGMWTAAVHNLSDIRSISAGSYHSLAVDSQGRVYSWGLNDSGQVGVRGEGDDCGIYYWCLNEPRYIGQWVGSEPVAGRTTSMVVTDYGTLHVWGNNGMGQLGVTSSDECWYQGDAAGYHCSFSPIRVTGLPSVSTVSVGGVHALALTLDGDVYAWGSAMHGQLGTPSSGGCSPGATPPFPCSTTPLHVSTLSGAVDVAAGGRHSLAVLSNGTVWSWGLNDHGQLGDGTTGMRTSPTLIQAP